MALEAPEKALTWATPGIASLVKVARARPAVVRRDVVDLSGRGREVDFGSIRHDRATAALAPPR